MSLLGILDEWKYRKLEREDAEVDRMLGWTKVSGRTMTQIRANVGKVVDTLPAPQWPHWDLPLIWRIWAFMVLIEQVTVKLVTNGTDKQDSYSSGLVRVAPQAELHGSQAGSLHRTSAPGTQKRVPVRSERGLVAHRWTA